MPTSNIEFFKHRGYWRPRSQSTLAPRPHGYVILDEPPDEEHAADLTDDEPEEERSPS